MPSLIPANCLRGVDVPQGCETWLATGVWETDLEDSVVLWEICENLLVEHGADKYALAESENGGRHLLIANEEPIIETVHAMLDAWEMGDLIDDDKTVEFFDTQISLRWEAMSTPDRVILLDLEDEPPELALQSAPPKFVRARLGLAVLRDHPSRDADTNQAWIDYYS
jgi:hypothetical protein